MDNILSVIEEAPQEMAMRIAGQVKARRLEMNLTQEGLCVRAGIKLPTYRRFERTGEISLKDCCKLLLHSTPCAILRRCLRRNSISHSMRCWPRVM